MAEDAGAVGADGNANADFAFTGDGSGEHESAEIGAGDGKNQQREHGHHFRGLVHFRLHHLHVSAGRDQDEFVVPYVFGVLAAQFIGERAQFFAGGLCGDTRSEAAPQAHGGVAGIGQRVAAFNEVGLLDDGHPDIGATATEGREGVGKHADEGCGFLVDVNDAPYDGGIAAEATLPEAIADDDGGRRSGIAVAGGIEEAAESGGRSQLGEVVGRDEGRGGLLDVVFELNGRYAHHAHDCRESFRVLPVEEERGVGGSVGVGIGRFAFETDERARIADRQGLERNHIEDRECRYVDADADGKHENGQKGETGRAAEGTRGVAQILKEAIEPGPAPGLLRLFAHAQGVAEVIASGIGGHFAMEVHVVLEFGIEAAAIDEIADAAVEFAHDGPPERNENGYAVRRISWIAWVTRSYSESSALRCLRPSGVRR